MKGPLTDKIRVLHVLDAIAEIESYLSGISYEEYLAISEKRFATIKQVEIIGEACNHITKAVKERLPQVPWKEINGFRNISIHEYFGVNFKLVWEIAQNDLPSLKQSLLTILTELDS